jgi:hypothetical protein
VKKTLFGIILLFVVAVAVACGGAEPTVEVAPIEESTEVDSSQSTQSLVENACAPGPSSNWCWNVQGDPCSGTWRRCFLPNYCEWMICLCENGAWNCEF